MEHYFTDGEIQIRGKKVERGEAKKADYLLYHQGRIPLAIVEAKKYSLSVRNGLQQAINYAELLDVPYAYSSNGKGFVEHDMELGTEKEIPLNKFPSPEELWKRYTSEKNINEDMERIITQPYYFDTQTKKIPRYYQRIAINKTIEAIAKGEKRILLVMATGTGKTFTAFQIAHRLWKSKTKKKILYLADRNILIDQTMAKDFKPFEKVMTKIQKHDVDSAYEIYFSLYHQLVNEELDEQPYQTVSPDFFDLIIVDECHRGSAKDDSQWRMILEYFKSATQIGMTATPKETDKVSNIHYFGKPLYTYSLKQGIEDGFLAPYKVIKIIMDVDAKGYRPEHGKLDFYGQEIEDREYNTNDFDREMVLTNRTKAVAKKITDYLKSTNRFDKTIVFCVDIDHAERMREALINENAKLVAENPKYVMKITGDDKEGKSQLDYFVDPDEKYPVIATTSQLLSTGVDCETCKLIVLDKNIESMTEFKQIIGRGTRLKTDYGKNYFTIMDFRNNTRKFADPDFDGKPMQDENYKEGDSFTPGGEGGNKNPKPEPHTPMKKYRVDDVDVDAILQQNLCYTNDGKLITTNVIDFTRRNILEEFPNLDDFINKWNSEDKKEVLIDELYRHNIFIDEIREAAGEKISDEMDDFDLICHIAFDKKPLTRSERANNVKKRDYLNKYEGVARQVLEALLDKYASSGITELEDLRILENEPFRKFGSPMKISNLFGGRSGYFDAVHGLQMEIYA